MKRKISEIHASFTVIHVLNKTAKQFRQKNRRASFIYNENKIQTLDLSVKHKKMHKSLVMSKICSNFVIDYAK